MEIKGKNDSRSLLELKNRDSKDLRQNQRETMRPDKKMDLKLIKQDHKQNFKSLFFYLLNKRKRCFLQGRKDKA